MNYIPNTDADRALMLEVVGANSTAELFRDVPEQHRFPTLNLPPALSEMEVLGELNALANENDDLQNLACFLGAGAYYHFVPSVVDFILHRSEFFTAYTPYQPEISQGTLQAHFEYQSMICALTGMEVSNVSHYDGATAVAEAVIMALQVGRGKRNKVILSPTLHPQYREVVRTYTQGMALDIVGDGVAPGDLDALAGLLDKQTACVIVQNPDFLGGSTLRPRCRRWRTRRTPPARSSSSRSIRSAWGCSCRRANTEPTSSPARGSRWATASASAGLYLGFFAMKTADVRRSAGRIVGQTVDVDGKRGLRADAQHAGAAHPPREGLQQYLHQPGAQRAGRGDLHGRDGKYGLRTVAELSYHKAHYAADLIREAVGLRGGQPGAVLQGICGALPAAGCVHQREPARSRRHDRRVRPGRLTIPASKITCWLASLR